MRFAVIGTGALGSLVAARLALAGYPVAVVDRPGSPHLTAIRRAGLILEEIDGSERTVPLSALGGPEAVAEAAVVVVLVKAWATEAAVAPVAAHLRPGTTLLTLQNGLGNAEAIRRALGATNEAVAVVSGVTSQAAFRLAPGRVRHAGQGPTLIGQADGRSERARTIADALTTARLPATVVPDIERHQWRKLAVNAAINGLTALAEVPNGTLIEDPELRHAAALVAREVEAVARARGIELGDVVAAVEQVARATAANRSSMLRDVETGGRTEVDAIHGAVVAAGEAVGVDVPATRVLAALVAARERANRRHG